MAVAVLAILSFIELSDAHLLGRSQPVTNGEPCSCEPSSSTWKRCARSRPRCVFIDLGAGDGHGAQTFADPEGYGFGPVKNCPSQGSWTALLVEPDPAFAASLDLAVAKYPGRVRALTSVAPYVCEGQVTIRSRPNDDVHNSSLRLPAPNPGIVDNSSSSATVRLPPGPHVPAPRAPLKVRTMNLNRVLYEQTIADDWVIVRMGSTVPTHAVLPCLATAPAAALIDQLYTSAPDPPSANAIAALKKRRVDVVVGYNPDPGFPSR